MADLEEELMFEYDSDDEKEKIQKEQEEAERARQAAQLLYDEDDNGEMDNGVKEVKEDLNQENNGEVNSSKSQHAPIDTNISLGVEQESGSDYNEVKVKPQLSKPNPAAGSVFSRLGPRSEQAEIETKQMFENCQENNESFGGGDVNSPAQKDEEENDDEDDEEEEEEQDDDSRRARFKSERSSVSRSISLTSEKPKWNIPDSLDDVVTPQPNMDQMRGRGPRGRGPRGGMMDPYQRGWDPYQRGMDSPYQRGMDSPYQRGMDSPYARGMDSPYQRGMDPYQRGMDPYQRGYEDPYQRNWDARSARFGMYGPNNGIRSLMDNTGMEEQQNQNSFILTPHSPQLQPLQQPLRAEPIKPQQSKLASIKSRLSMPNSKLKGVQTKTDEKPVAAASQPDKTATKENPQTTTATPTGKTPATGKALATGKVTATTKTPPEVQTTAVKRPLASNASENTAAQAKQIKLEIPHGKNPISLLHETFKGGTVKFLEKQIGTVPHNPEFECNVEIKGDRYHGVGKSKKVARLKAAEAAVLSLMQAGVIPMDESQTADIITPVAAEESTTTHGAGISPAAGGDPTEHGLPESDVSAAGAQTTTSLKIPSQAEVQKQPPSKTTAPQTETYSRTLPADTQQSQISTPQIDHFTDTTSQEPQIQLDIPPGKNVISILHEMCGNKIKFIDKNLGLVHAPEFECSVTLDGETYKGIGKQKKVAKKNAAEAMLLGLMQDWINGKYANISYAGTQTMNQLIDAHFRRQRQNGGPRQTSIIK